MATPAGTTVTIIAMSNKACRTGCRSVSLTMMMNRTPNWAMISLDTSAIAAPNGPMRGISMTDSNRNIASCRDLVQSKSGPRLL